MLLLVMVTLGIVMMIVSHDDDDDGFDVAIDIADSGDDDHHVSKDGKDRLHR